MAVVNSYWPCLPEYPDSAIGSEDWKQIFAFFEAKPEHEEKLKEIFLLASRALIGELDIWVQQKIGSEKSANESQKENQSSGSTKDSKKSSEELPHGELPPSKLKEELKEIHEAAERYRHAIKKISRQARFLIYTGMQRNSKNSLTIKQVEEALLCPVEDLLAVVEEINVVVPKNQIPGAEEFVTTLLRAYKGIHKKLPTRINSAKDSRDSSVFYKAVAVSSQCIKRFLREQKYTPKGKEEPEISLEAAKIIEKMGRGDFRGVAKRVLSKVGGNFRPI